MKITVIGAGAIGGNLASKLASAGHDVHVADARGTEAIAAEVVESGAKPVEVDAAVSDRDVIILSIPFDRVPELADLIAKAPAETIVVDTSNYYPFLNGEIDAVNAANNDDPAVETEYNSALLGRPLVKAWNAALAGTQQAKAAPAGTPGRIAIPVAADSPDSRRVVMQLVDDTGFDPYDAGVLADSWRQQPMGPGYCTELTLDELERALARADRVKDTAVRDSIGERMAALGDSFTHDDVVEMNRAAHR